MVASVLDMHRHFFLVIILKTIGCNNDLHSIYLVVGSISNREIRDNMHRLYTNIMPFYTRKLSILGFWYPWASWK